MAGSHADLQLSEGGILKAARDAVHFLTSSHPWTLTLGLLPIEVGEWETSMPPCQRALSGFRHCYFRFEPSFHTLVAVYGALPV